MNKFDEIYEAIKKRENYVAPENLSPFDNWATDRFEIALPYNTVVLVWISVDRLDDQEPS